jgi:hypothetical protein
MFDNKSKILFISKTTPTSQSNHHAQPYLLSAP